MGAVHFFLKKALGHGQLTDDQLPLGQLTLELLALRLRCGDVAPSSVAPPSATAEPFLARDDELVSPLA